VRILEPSARRGRAEILATKVDLRRVEFPGVNLEALPFEDASFDHVVTADVFEHVRRDDLAFAEVFRVLRPGGHFYLQVPFRPDSPTETRVRVEGDRDVLLFPPEYHAGRTLVYRIYGHDVLPRLEAAGFEARVVSGEDPRWGVPAQELLLAKKADRRP
jgi:ubiquinone/menaquinone biosynthesis C-methylase UbiE